MAFTHALSTNNYGPAKFIVSATAALGTHTTIASALSDAVSGETIFIRDGIYTEDYTLKAGVTITAFSSLETDLNATGVPSVTIIGNAAATFVGACVIANVRLKTNSGTFLTISGSSDTVVQLINCELICSNNTGISSTSSGTSSKVWVQNCYGDIQTTGITLFTSSSAGLIYFYKSSFSNTGVSTTASTISSGILVCRYSRFGNTITTSGTVTRVQMEYSQIITTNIVSLTHNSTVADLCDLSFCQLSSGTASAITAGAGATIQLLSCELSTSNVARTSGSGTITIIGSEQVATSYATGSGSATPVSTTGVLTIAGAGTVTTSGSGSTVTITGSGGSLTTAFLATQTTAQNNITANTNTTLKINNEVFDVGSNYNNSTYTFTAPSTGKYNLTANITIDQVSTGDFAQLNLVTTSTLFFKAYAANLELSSTGTVTMCLSVLALMTAGDTALVKYQTGAGASSTADVRTDAAGASGTWFSGWLVG